MYAEEVFWLRWCKKGKEEKWWSRWEFTLAFPASALRATLTAFALCKNAIVRLAHFHGIFVNPRRYILFFGRGFNFINCINIETRGQFCQLGLWLLCVWKTKSKEDRMSEGVNPTDRTVLWFEFLVEPVGIEPTSEKDPPPYSSQAWPQYWDWTLHALGPACRILRLLNLASSPHAISLKPAF